MRKAATIMCTIVLSLSVLVLIVAGASWADASHPSPPCGGEYLNPGEVCDDNGVDTTYDDAIVQQRNARDHGPIGVAVSSAFPVASIALLVVLRRRNPKRTG